MPGRREHQRHPTDITVNSGLHPTLRLHRDGPPIGRLLSLLFVSLTVIGAVVVLLGARLLAEHRRRALR